MDGEVLGVKPEGEYELIETITITEEDVLRITRDNLNLKSAMVKYFVEPLNQITYIITGFMVGKSSFAFTQNYQQSTAKQGARVELYPQYGFYTGMAYKPSITYSNAGTAEVPSNYDSTRIRAINNITGINISIYRDYFFPNGTNIEIWGVRA
jgi:hypothetical protein